MTNDSIKTRWEDYKNIIRDKGCSNEQIKAFESVFYLGASAALFIIFMCKNDGVIVNIKDELDDFFEDLK